jgi:hypothetical protein
MPSFQELIVNLRSGVISISFYLNDVLISSGSGFIYKGKLVSNNHVFNPNEHPFDSQVVVGIRFGDTSQYSNDDFRVKYGDLKLMTGSDESSYDYAVYEFPTEVKERYNFDIGHSGMVEGKQVMLLGYPFGSKYMTSHIGYISALFEKGSVKYIQLDASVNSGNSGGPLIDTDNGNILGIITRKQTGLSDKFDDLITSFDENIKALEAIRGTVRFSGVDPIDVLQVSQRQMQTVTEDMKRSANTGIGYAFDCEKLANELLE